MSLFADESLNKWIVIEIGRNSVAVMLKHQRHGKVYYAQLDHVVSVYISLPKLGK